MKKDKKYLALASVTTLAVLAMSFGTLSFAQTATTTSALSCSSGDSVNANQVAILTATGGTGSYVWSGQNIDITDTSGNQFAVSYPIAGTYTITVKSGSQTATCNVTFGTAASTGGLVCSPVVQTVRRGQTATFSASGGTGTYTWSSPDLTITNPNGSGFSASFPSGGIKTVRVSNGGATATCAVNVIGGIESTPPVVPTTPGFPNTGGGFGR